MATDNNKVIGWEAYAFLVGENTPLGGGFALGNDRESARRIAVAEVIERSLIRAKLNDPTSSIYTALSLGRNPSSSGFAFGLEPQQATFRSLCEAYEHYVRYFGIYEGFPLFEEDFAEFSLRIESSEHSDLVRTLKAKFDSVRLFSKKDVVKIGEYEVELRCLITFGIKGNGVFIGAKSSSASDLKGLLCHSLLEAWRNLRIFERHKKMVNINTSEPIASARRRNLYFGSHLSEATAQVNSRAEKWPKPELMTCICEAESEVGGYLSRSLFNGVPPWASLSEERLI